MGNNRFGQDDARLSPLLASGGLLAIVTGVMAYVYNLEVRLHDEMRDLRADISLLDRRMDATDKHIDSGQETIARRWVLHDREHERNAETFRIVVSRLIDTGGLSSKGTD